MDTLPTAVYHFHCHVITNKITFFDILVSGMGRHGVAHALAHVRFDPIVSICEIVNIKCEKYNTFLFVTLHSLFVSIFLIMLH